MTGKPVWTDQSTRRTDGDQWECADCHTTWPRAAMGPPFVHDTCPKCGGKLTGLRSTVEAQIDRLTLGPRDVLHIRADTHLDPQQAREIAERAYSTLTARGLSVPVLVTGPDITIEVRPDDT